MTHRQTARYIELLGQLWTNAQWNRKALPDRAALGDAGDAVPEVVCWQSRAAGDVAASTRQTRVSADLRLFGVCARLMPE